MKSAAAVIRFSRVDEFREMRFSVMDTKRGKVLHAGIGSFLSRQTTVYFLCEDGWPSHQPSTVRNTQIPTTTRLGYNTTVPPMRGSCPGTPAQ